MVIVYVLRTPALDAGDAADILAWVFYILLPNFCFGDSLENLYMNYQLLSVCKMVLPYCPKMVTQNQCCPSMYNSDFTK